MGCSVCKGGRGKKQTPDEIKTAEDDVSNPPLVATQLATSTTSSSATPVVGFSADAAKKDGKNLSARDVSEDEDEIEIIYETAPKKISPKNKEDPYAEQARQIDNAANGQEPPDAYEPESRPKRAFEAFGDKPAEQAEPLSKAQQEEAAKLAERRQKFDNQRYQRDSAAAPNASVERSNNPLLKEVGKDVGRTSPPLKMNKPITATPTTDMVLGLNQNSNNRSSQPVDAFCGLPGGIMDDMETIPVASSAPPKKNNNHNKHGFDADEEQLMAEILDELQDVEDL